MSVIQKFLRHRFVKQAGWSLFYLGLSRVFAIVGTAWAARCLGPFNNGISGQINATMGQMVLFVTFSLDNLFIRRYKHATTEKERQDCIAVAMSQRFYFSLILGLAAIPASWLVLKWVHPPGHWWLGIYASFALFILTCVQPTWIAVACEDVPLNFRAASISSIIGSLMYMAFFRPGEAAGADLLVLALQMFLQFYLLTRSVLPRAWPLPIYWGKIRQFWPILREGRWLFISGLLIYVYINLEVPMLGYLCSLEELGKYRVATSLIYAVQQILTLAPMLLYPRFVEWGKQGPRALWRKQLQLTGFFLIAGAPVCLVVFLLSPPFFHLFYGQAYAGAAIPFAILATSKIVVLLNSIYSYGLWAQSEDVKVFWVMFPTAAISFLCNVFLLPRYGMYGACSINLLSETLVFIGCFIFAYRHMKQNIRQAAPEVPGPAM